ncbi:MAG: acyl-CoA dehydrogenase family protein [Sphingomonas sp.]
MTLDDVAARGAYGEEHEAFRQTVRQFLRKEGVPHVADWEADRLVPPAFWRAAKALLAKVQG